MIKPHLLNYEYHEEGFVDLARLYQRFYSSHFNENDLKQPCLRKAFNFLSNQNNTFAKSNYSNALPALC